QVLSGRQVQAVGAVAAQRPGVETGLLGDRPQPDGLAGGDRDRLDPGIPSGVESRPGTRRHPTGLVAQGAVEVGRDQPDARERTHEKIIGRSPSSSPPPKSRSTTTGTWSLGCSPLRSSRWIDAPVTASAKGLEPSTKSIRMPSLRGNLRRW